MKQHIFARLSIVFMLACTCAIGGASGAYAQVVAFGASITQGKGVSGQEAYPARLEALLRSKGINVTVVNQGINGDTLQNMQNRMDRAVPQGTRVVILQVGAPNARQGKEEGGILKTRFRACAAVWRQEESELSLSVVSEESPECPPT